MIEFACRCGQIFSLDDSEAGGSVQCPGCGRLNDVPHLQDLPNLASDGTYQIDQPPPSPQGNRLAELAVVFRKARVDDAGDQIDLRTIAQHHVGVAGGAPPLSPLESDTFSARPRYDPETGELIRPLEVKSRPLDHVRPSDIPLARPALVYATGTAAEAQSWPDGLMRLFMPINLVVMFIALMIHLITLWMFAFTLAMGLFLISPALIIVQLSIVSHYGNIIDEAGPEQHDELPRFLRDFRLYEDVWFPLRAMIGGVLLCYAPAIMCLLAVVLSPPTFLTLSDILMGLVLVIFTVRMFIAVMQSELATIQWTDDVVLPFVTLLLICMATFAPAGLCLLLHPAPPVGLGVAGALAIFGTIFLPGVLLTLMTSGSAVNLRPDRLLKTIARCGLRYLLALAMWTIAIPAYVLGQLILVISVVALVTGSSSAPPWMQRSSMAVPLLLLGVLAMHSFCFELGMLYRQHHPSFPWLFQFHVRQRDEARSEPRRREDAKKYAK